MSDRKEKEYHIGGSRLIIFLFGLSLMVLFLALGLNGIITTGDNAIFDLVVVMSMIAAYRWVDSRKKSAQ